MSTSAVMRFALVLGAAATIASPVAAQAAPPGGNDAHRFLTVMTRNLDEGTDFGFIIGALGNPSLLPGAFAATYGEVLASDVCGRAAAIADEIATAQPDIVSIQEAARWTGPLPANCPASGSTTTIDAGAALLARLEADGARYVPVWTQDEFSSQPISFLLPPGLSFLDRDIMLARVEPPGQLTLSNVTHGTYPTLLPLPLTPALSIPITRGWIAADATVRGRTTRVVATHLESFNGDVQTAQAMELAAGPANTSLPVIVAGDLNTGPGATFMDAYNWLTSPAGGGFTDTWAAVNPNDPGFTDSFYTEDPPTPATPSERIDLVLVRGGVLPSADARVGLEVPHPSDHAGVVATVRIPS